MAVQQNIWKLLNRFRGEVLQRLDRIISLLEELFPSDPTPATTTRSKAKTASASTKEAPKE